MLALPATGAGGVGERVLSGAEAAGAGLPGENALAVALAEDGSAVAVWEQRGVRVALRGARGGAWRVVRAGGAAGYAPALALAADGTAVVAWMEGAGGAIRWAVRDPGAAGLGTPSTVARPAPRAARSDLRVAAAPGGVAVAAWTTGRGRHAEVRVAVRPGTGAGTTGVRRLAGSALRAPVDQGLALSAGPGGEVAIAWPVRTAGGEAVVVAERGRAGAWGPARPAGPPAGRVIGPVVAHGRAGEMTVTWTASRARADLRGVAVGRGARVWAARRQAGAAAFAGAAPVSAPGVVSTPAVAVAPDEGAWVAWERAPTTRQLAPTPLWVPRGLRTEAVPLLGPAPPPPARRVSPPGARPLYDLSQRRPAVAAGRAGTVVSAAVAVPPGADLSAPGGARVAVLAHAPGGGPARVLRRLAADPVLPAVAAAGDGEVLVLYARGGRMRVVSLPLAG